MAKRKHDKEEENESDGDEDGGENDVRTVNVDFDFFAPHPEVDYLALKRLFIQLFQGDAVKYELNPGDLAELVLEQPAVGSTVKLDGEEGDPYGVVTVVNLCAHQERPSIKALVSYVLEKASSTPAAELVQSLLGPDGLKNSSPNHVGLVVSERLVNMPAFVVPPMYRSLVGEIKEAIDAKEAFTFSHYLFITRTYRMTPKQYAELQAQSSGSDGTLQPTKKKKKSTTKLSGDGGNGDEMDMDFTESTTDSPKGEDKGAMSSYSFHPEDECIQSCALFTWDYPLSSHQQQPRTEESLGLDMGGRMMLVPAEKFEELVDMMVERFPS